MNMNDVANKVGQASRLSSERFSASRFLPSASPTVAGETPALLFSQLYDHESDAN
jgi:hypothetical protein